MPLSIDKPLLWPFFGIINSSKQHHWLHRGLVSRDAVGASVTMLFKVVDANTNTFLYVNNQNTCDCKK